MPSKKTIKTARADVAGGPFKIDPGKHKTETKAMLFSIDPDLHCWVKVMAVVNGVTIVSALNQAIEYAKDNSERINL